MATQFTDEQMDAFLAAINAQQTPVKPTYELGGDNTDWIAQEYGDSGAQASWQDNVTRTILKELTDTAKRIGEDPNVYSSIYENSSQPFFAYMEEYINSFVLKGPITRDTLFQGKADDIKKLLQSEQGWNQVLDKARDYWKVHLNDARFSDNWGTGSGTGGGGSRLPTAEEIRQGFDVTQLANGVQNLWQGTLMDDHKDPRGLAQQYIEAVVSTQGQQKIDFESFVMAKARATGRYAAIYKNKPEGFTEAQFLQPYVAKAMANVKPSNVRGLAIGMAQFNASPQQMDERIKRSDQNQASSPFINELEGRLTSLNKVFKG